jgi:hypothetical protein
LRLLLPTWWSVLEKFSLGFANSNHIYPQTKSLDILLKHPSSRAASRGYCWHREFRLSSRWKKLLKDAKPEQRGDCNLLYFRSNNKGCISYNSYVLWEWMSYFLQHELNNCCLKRNTYGIKNKQRFFYVFD